MAGEEDYEPIGAVPNNIPDAPIPPASPPKQPVDGGKPLRDDDVDLNSGTGNTKPNQKGKSAEKVSKKQTKKKKTDKKGGKKEKNGSRTLWMGILFASCAVVLLAVVLTVICAAHRWMGASFIPALTP